MGRIPQPFLDDLLARTDIVELIDRAVPLKKAGTNMSACCPFHQEKSPSFTVSPSKQFYHCFGCGAHGNAISFLIEYERLEFRDAVETLARAAGLEMPKDTGPSHKEDDNIIKIYEALSCANDFYQARLREHSNAIDYLKQRGLSGKTAKDFQLGYAPAGWDNCLKACKNKGFTETTLLQAGLIIRNDEGKRYDRFRDRIMFPIRDARARVVGFGGRVFDDGQPKYLNSPETPAFQKGRELYGLYEARKKHRKLERVLIVEGYMDVIGLAEHGVDYAIATLGTATSAHHLQTLFRHTSEILFCFDGDNAGKKAAWRALEVALPIMQDNKHIRFAFLPEGEDPDSYISKYGLARFEELCKNASSFTDFLLETLSTEVNLQSIDGRAHLAKSAMVLIERLPNGMLKPMIVRALANIVRMDANELMAPQTRQTQVQTKARIASRPPGIMRSTLSLLVQHPKLCTHVPKGLPTVTLPGGSLLHDLIALLRENPTLKTAALVERYREHPDGRLLAKLASMTHVAPESGIQSEFTDSLSRLVKLQHEQTIESLMAKAAVSPGLTAEEKKQLQALILAQNVCQQE